MRGGEAIGMNVSARRLHLLHQWVRPARCVSLSVLLCLVDTNKNQTEKILTGCAARFKLCSDAVQPQGYIKQLTHNTCPLSGSKHCGLG